MMNNKEKEVTKYVIPIVPLDINVIKIIKELEINEIIVSFYRIINSKKYNSIINESINGLLDYSGRVYLSSIMPDELLLREETFNQFIHLLDKGNFYAAIAWDMPVEMDLSREERWRNLQESLSKLESLKELGFKIIPLAKGNYGYEIDFSINTIKNIGFRNIALHASEYTANLHDGISRDILRRYLITLEKAFNKIHLIGVLRPYVLNFIFKNIYRREKYVYCGLSWLLDAKENIIYSSDNIVNLNKNILITDRAILTYKDSQEKKAKHNLNTVIDKIGNIQKRYDIFDTYLNPPILVLSDLHIGLPESLFEETLRLIRRINARTIVLNGDIFDYMGHIELSHLIDFFNVLKEKDFEIIAISGEKEKGFINPERKFLEILDNLVFGDDPWTRPFNKDLIQRFILWFYKINRVMRKEVIGVLPDRTKIFFTHGNNMGLYTLPSEKIVSKAVFMKKIKKVDMVILGHFYRFIMDRKNNVYVSGGLINPLEEMLKRKFLPERGVLILKKNGEVEAISI